MHGFKTYYLMDGGNMGNGTTSWYIIIQRCNCTKAHGEEKFENVKY